MKSMLVFWKVYSLIWFENCVKLNIRILIKKIQILKNSYG